MKIQFNSTCYGGFDATFNEDTFSGFDVKIQTESDGFTNTICMEMDSTENAYNKIYVFTCYGNRSFEELKFYLYQMAKKYANSVTPSNDIDNTSQPPYSPDPDIVNIEGYVQEMKKSNPSSNGDMHSCALIYFTIN